MMSENIYEIGQQFCEAVGASFPYWVEGTPKFCGEEFYVLLKIYNYSDPQASMCIEINTELLEQMAKSDSINKDAAILARGMRIKFEQAMEELNERMRI